MDKELARAIEVFSDFFNSLEYPVGVIDIDGKYIYCNPAGAEMDDCRVENNVGSHILDLYPNLTCKTSTLLRSLQNGERFINQDQNYRTQSGKVVNHIHNTLPLYNSKGNIVGAVEICRDITNIKALTEQVLELSARLYGESNNNDNEKDNSCNEIITNNPDMLKTLKELECYAQTDFAILIYGETGTGKELLVKYAHAKSKRAEKPLITLNCAAIPETLLESMLFGTSKGAFTGAENRKGMFEIADGGTLFLDELNSMPAHIQGKLLRVLQDGQITRLGSTRPIKADVRIIAAINESPEEAIKNGNLRSDLFYRLSVGYVSVPPLRQRKDDIRLLASHFIKKYSAELNSNVRLINPRVLSQMEQLDWPGNVRMLENTIKRSLMLEDPNNIALNQIHFINEHKDIHTSHKTEFIPANPKPSPVNLPLQEQIAIYESTLIKRALQDSDGEIKKAAELLQIPRTTLHYKIKKYELHHFCKS